MIARAHSHWVATAVVTWVAITLALAIYGYHYPRTHTVYDVYELASRRWWAGEDLYLDSSQGHYRYSPLFAVGITPFALLPDSWGNALWRVFNSLIYVAGIASWARRALPGRRTSTQIAALLLLALPLSLQSLQNAQANLLMLGAVLLALSAAAEERWSSSAGWLALATLIKGYPLALAGILIVLYPRRFTLRFAAALAVGLLLPFAAQSPAVVAGNYASWFTHLSDSTSIMRERLRSIDHLFAIYGQPLAPRTFLWLQLSAGLAVLGLCAVHMRLVRDQRDRLAMTFLLFTAWVALFGPATESCTYVVVAPALAWLILDSFVEGASWASRLILIASLVLMGPIGTDVVGQTVRNFANEHGCKPIGALLFLSVLLLRLGSPHRLETSEITSANAFATKAAA